MNRKYLFLIILLGIFSCNVKDSDPAEEDYSKLFPWKGIEKPENAYEDMNVRLCNPNDALSSYRYPGVSIDNQREYDVTIKCQYREAPQTSSLARFEVRFIDDKKQIVAVGSDASNSNITHKLTDGVEFSKTFRVKSGYPMYLLVNGIGDRGSNIKASISAVSKDGLIVVPTLSTEQSQNNEGPNRIPSPYCEYIILP
ncbi:hypothetical protein [Capnocytophaga canimorsus]|uniref:hypothetical protein n=1 Tax=Capnocytophaga canimorsus TaxID=28188 RepID=UPI000CC5F9A4|nr:hypothetical protein [Capnocytophaga canimorsus]PJI76651.1 hypothetical protein CLV61_1918 [Capnocytophaga canimorsus]STA72942.1 Uncharacterised protein [Capnocytophaga canimorsus]